MRATVIGVAAWWMAAMACGCEANRSPGELARIAGQPGSAVNAPDAFRFVVLSDRTGHAGAGKLARAVQQINLLAPDFVMCVGDLIEGYVTDEAKVVKQWEQVEGALAALDAPFF